MSHQAGVHVALPAPYPPQLDQVLPSTEALLASTRNDGTAQVVFLVEPIEHLAHFLVPGEGNAVHLLLAVDGDEEDIVGWVGEEDVGGGRRCGLGLDGRHIAGR